MNIGKLSPPNNEIDFIEQQNETNKWIQFGRAPFVGKIVELPE